MIEDSGYWNATAGLPATAAFPKLASELTVDIAVIGAGIVGVSAARALKDLGLTVALVEARRVGRQVTGKSTAKISSQHSLIYSKLVEKFDDEFATQYGAAQQAGLQTIRDWAERHSIDCDLETQRAYLYTRDAARVDAVTREGEVARRCGLPASMGTDIGLPFPVLAAVCFESQAQFHPVKYLVGLAATIPGDGCHVFEQSQVTDWTPRQVTTARGTVHARHVVMATHLPLGMTDLLYARAYPHAEAVIAAPIARAPTGMFLSADQPTHSLRTHRRADGTVVAVATGPRFKLGDADEQRKCFDEIEAWLATNFDAGAVEYRWVNEDYASMDAVPFVGWSSNGDHAYLVATGFDGWGISNGATAGRVLADLAAGHDNPFADLLDARRVRPVAGGKKFVAENAAVAVALARNHLARKPKSLDEVAPGHAAVLKLDGDIVAAFRDDAGAVHAVSAKCTHMGCLVGWNEIDRTWDCACHGSRFGPDGAVIHGPAVQPLAPRYSGSVNKA